MAENKIEANIQVHKDIYEKFEGTKTIPLFLNAIEWLRKIHYTYPNDILTLDISQYAKLIYEPDLRDPRNKFWSKNNPFPINSCILPAEIADILTTRSCVQTAERINHILSQAENDSNMMIVCTTYEKLIGLWVCQLKREEYIITL
jgi:hypothetical protein